MMKNAESDVGGGLNDGIQKRMNGIGFERASVVAANCELEFVQRELV